MKALILCAGLGTRLRPLTERWPKPAIPLLGQPLLRYALSTLSRSGVDAVAINSFHLPEVMEAVAQAECARKGLPLEVNREVGQIQGTGGGIRGLRRFLEGEDFLVFNGDVLFAVDLGPVVAAHRRSRAAATMVLMPMPAGESYKAVEVDAQMRVRRIAGHGPGGERLTNWHFTGVHVMSPEVFDFMSQTGAEDINHDVYPRLISAGRLVQGVVAQGYWSDLGTPQRYLKTQQDLLFGQVPLEPFGEDSPLLGATRAGHVWRRGVDEVGRVAGPAFIDRARVDPTAWLGANVYVGEGAQVGAGARINRGCVLEGARVEDGEQLVDAIAWTGGRIRAG